MMTKGRMGTRATIGLLATVASLTLADRAEAQYGGYGFGFGLGYNQNAYTDVNFLNSRSLVNASIAGNHRPQPLTAPTFQSRDEGFLDRYDLSTREAMVNRIARDPNREMGTVDPTGLSRRSAQVPAPQPRTTAPGPAPPPAPTSVHLVNFFNKDRQLVWPSASPITGDYGKQQTAADLAVLAVLNEYDTRGLAQISTVTEARRKLIDYGQPALQYVRQNSTPALADTFHTFLLALYGNVGLAATVPKAPEIQPQPPR